MKGNSIKPGIYTTLSSEEYHSHKESISRSALMDFMRSAYTYWAKHLNADRQKRDATPQMELGTSFHTLILEPQRFDEEYVMKPEPVLLKNVGREAYEAYKNVVSYLENTDKKVLSADDWKNLMAMRDKLHSNKEVVELLANARIENSFFWQDKESGLLLKARPDALHENIILDLKTTFDASPRAFQNDMVKGGYHIQFAMIRNAVEALEGRRIENFINIVIENKYPYNMAIYIVDEAAVDVGQEKYKQALIELKEAKETNYYADYGIQTISLPKWAL